MLKTLTCIICPVGCSLTVDYYSEDKHKDISVSGAQCSRGENYGIEEVTNPKRTLQTSVRVEGGHLPLVSVKTSNPLPKEKMNEVMTLINRVTVKAPIMIGDIIIENILNLNVSIVATKNIEKTNC